MATPSANEAPAWYEFVVNYDATVKNFEENYAALLALGPEINNYPGLWPQYDALVNEGADIRQNLQKLKDTRDYMASWLNWLQGGAVGAFNWLGRQVGFSGLGIAPLFVIVGIGSAAAVLLAASRWLANTYTLAQRWNAFLDMKRTGATNEQAAAAVNGMMGAPPTSDFLGIPWALLAWAAIAVYLGPPILRAISGRKE
jgi:hypothetical protein